MATPMVKLARHLTNTKILLRKLSRAVGVYSRTQNVSPHQQSLIFKACKTGIYQSAVLSAVGLTTHSTGTDATAKTVSSEPNTEKDSERSFEPNDPRLRSHECLKNAAGLSVDSTSAVLSQTVYALTKIEGEYVELVNVLIILMEYQLQVLGHAAEEERIGSLIVETRHEVNKVRQRKEDLALLFASAEKLADATAEVAFAAGAEYASTSAGERLYSAQREVKQVQSRSREAERRLHEAQAKSIQVQTEHEERAAEQTQQELPAQPDDTGTQQDTSGQEGNDHTEPAATDLNDTEQNVGS